MIACAALRPTRPVRLGRPSALPHANHTHHEEHATATANRSAAATKPPKKPLSLYNHFLKLERAAIAVTMPESATTCEVRGRRSAPSVSAGRLAADDRSTSRSPTYGIRLRPYSPLNPPCPDDDPVCHALLPQHARRATLVPRRDARQYNAITSDKVLRCVLPACRLLHVALRTSPVNRMDAASVRRCVDVPGQD